MTPENDRLAERIARLEERVGALDRLIHASFANRDHAFSLQVEDLSRRMSELNHETERISAAAARHVNVGVYDAEMKAVHAALAGVKEYADTTRGGIEGREIALFIVFGLGSFLAAISAIVLHLSG